MGLFANNTGYRSTTRIAVLIMLLNYPDYIQRAKNKRDKYKDWHSWFAWYPVRIDQSRLVWLETVYRRIRYIPEEVPRFYGWDYTLDI